MKAVEEVIRVSKCQWRLSEQSFIDVGKKSYCVNATRKIFCVYCFYSFLEYLQLISPTHFSLSCSYQLATTEIGLKLSQLVENPAAPILFPQITLPCRLRETKTRRPIKPQHAATAAATGFNRKLSAAGGKKNR